MYLLMLLATFVSAIYGFNLSVRPDYDRDIVRKKAASMLYRFNFQTYVVGRIISKVETYNTLDGEAYNYGIQPLDSFYATDVNKLTYRRGIGGNSTHEFLVQGDDAEGQHSLHLLPEGRELYDGSEMYSRVYCLPYNPATKKYYDLNDYDGNYQPKPSTEVNSEGNLITDVAPDSQNCSSDGNIDEEGGITGSCCWKNGRRYLITFRKMDARWINRLTNYVNYDFQRAVIEYPFAENLGYVYKDSSNHWHFEGRIRLLPVYIDDMNKWIEEHKNETDMFKRQFPTKYRNKTTWDMPINFFTPDFFNVTNPATNQTEDYCANGCLFKIKQI